MLRRSDVRWVLNRRMPVGLPEIYLSGGPAIIHEPIACSLRPRKHRETFAPVLFVIPASLLAFGSRTPLGRARCPNQPLRGRTRVGNGQRSRRMLMECGGTAG